MSSSTGRTPPREFSPPRSGTTARRPVNLGSGEEISIRDLASLIAWETGYAGEIRWDTSRPNGQPRRKLDVTRAEHLFGWRSRVSLPEGLRQAIDWYRGRTQIV